MTGGKDVFAILKPLSSIQNNHVITSTVTVPSGISNHFAVEKQKFPYANHNVLDGESPGVYD
jgi:hypothetical protein